MPPEIVGDPLVLLVLAREDLQTARGEGNPSRPRAYHCQQAAEKALKATLSHFNRAYRKQHDMADLLSRIKELAIDVPDDVRTCDRLEAYIWHTRYDIGLIDVADQQVDEAIAQATAVVEWASSFIEPN